VSSDLFLVKKFRHFFNFFGKKIILVVQENKKMILFKETKKCHNYLQHERVAKDFLLSHL
jgi:hypothetical protein